MAKFRLSPKAEDDLFFIWLNIAKNNLAAADRLYKRILNRIELAAKSPYIGKKRPELNAKARILIESRYIIIYEPDDKEITVIAIVHGMRHPKNWLT